MPKEEKDAIYAGPGIEIMKSGGRGTHGHVAVAANDISAARQFLEGLGCTFDDSSAKYDASGRLVVLYMT